MNVAEFRALVKRTRHGRTSSRDVARAFLQETGVITADGNLAAPYNGRDWCDEMGELIDDCPIIMPRTRRGAPVK